MGAPAPTAVAAPNGAAAATAAEGPTTPGPLPPPPPPPPVVLMLPPPPPQFTVLLHPPLTSAAATSSQSRALMSAGTRTSCLPCDFQLNTFGASRHVQRPRVSASSLSSPYGLVHIARHVI